MTGIQNPHSKVCFKCGAEKPLLEFYEHSRMKDGHLNKCKSCTKTDAGKHRKDNLDKVKDYDRNRPNREKRNKERVDRFKEDYKLNPTKYLQRQREERANNPSKYKARNAVNNAVRDGRLERPDHCTECRKGCIPEGHHESYNKEDWLCVIWLCTTCHDNKHRVV